MYPTGKDGTHNGEVSFSRTWLHSAGPKKTRDDYPMTKKTPSRDEICLRTRNRLPLYRSINSVTILADFVREYGIQSDMLLAGSGIKSADLNDPDMMITPKQEMAVFRKILELIPDPKLGLDVGRNYNVSANNKVAIPAMFCDTFLDYIRMMFQYIELTLSYFRYDLTTSGDLVYLKMEELIDLGDLRHFVTDRELMSVFMISNGVLGGNFRIQEIRLAFPRPDHAPCYEELFRCLVCFNAEANTVIFSRDFLSRPLPMANSLSRHVYEMECKKLYSRLKEQGTTLEKIHQELLYHEGFPSFDQLARRLNVSPRTLRRHLTAEGTSYKILVNGMRKEKALHLLNTTDFTIEKIATMLGYSDVPNFYHAFKSWTDTTPSSYRRKRQ
jgi:AraC-like DNA-binding protein